MASIEEVGKNTKKKFNEIMDTMKKKFKEKPVFYTALICVVIYALYKLFHSSETAYTEEEETVTNAYVPVGYDGYPGMSESMLEDLENMYGGAGTVSGGTVSGGTTSSGAVNGESSSYVEDSYIFDTSYMENMETYNKELLQQMTLLEEQMWTMEQDALAKEMVYTEDGEVYNALGDLIYSPTGTYKVLFPGEAGYDTQMSLETANNKAWRNSQLQQMQANSAAYSKATSQAEKDALHSANVQIAKGLGLTYNKSNGKWYEADGSEALIYSNTSSKTSGSKNSTTSGSKSYGGIAYDPGTDYAAKIQQAKASGASQSVIDTLTAQRNAKIAGENLNSDGSKKTTTSTKSGSSWGGSSTTKTTTTSSGKTVTTGGGGGSFGGVSYDKNTDYAQKIKDAKASGASQATINKLQAQREAKIKGENLNSDGTKKK